MKQMIIEQIRQAKIGNKSNVRMFVSMEEHHDTIAQIILDVVAVSLSTATPLTSACRKVATRCFVAIGAEVPEGDSNILSTGIQMIDWVANAGLIDVEKVMVGSEKGDKAKEQWFITSLSKELTDYASTLSPTKVGISPLAPHQDWNKPTMVRDGQTVDLVKKAKRYGLLSNYTKEAMPVVFDAVNRLGRQGFVVNKRILDLATSCDFVFNPRRVIEDERRTALNSINDINRKAKIIAEIRFKEMNKWFMDEIEDIDPSIASRISRKRASEKTQDYLDTASEEHLAVISDWSKRLDFDRTTQLAFEWMNGTIHYTYQFDTRGRLYTIQNYLSPLGSDYAKSLLLFDVAHQVSGYDLCIHIANCFGNDKLSFDERVEWVNENSAELQEIGRNPQGNYHLIEKHGLQKEQKTKWQGIAACMVYADYCEYVAENGSEDGFTSNLIIGLDSTASGTQILTMLGRDDRVAPFVNVSKTDGRVGDFYTYLANYLRPKLEEHRGQSETLDPILDDWDKYARKLAKRNSMTFSYSGTKFGFGSQHWQDRHSYGELGSNLSRSDCRIIGNEMYDVCVENIRGGAEIMDWLRNGIDYHNGGAVITWTLPDGFKAFQVCDKGKRASVKGVIGTRNVQLVFFKYEDKPAVAEHKNGISPNFIHSLDAFLLRNIVNKMPADAPISTIHDQFSTSSYYIEDLQAVAKDAYREVADRDEVERMAEEAFGHRRELPQVGTWSIDEISEAEFIVC